MVERAEVLSALKAGQVPTEPLIRWLRDREVDLVQRGSAARFLRRSRPDPRAFVALKEALLDPHPLIRFSAVDGIASFPGADPELKRALRDPRRIVRVRAYEALLSHRAPGLEQPQWAQVRAEYQELEEILADDPRVLSKLALLAFKSRDPSKAEAILRRGQELSAPASKFQIDLVQLLLGSGRLEAAELALADLQPQLPKARMLKGQLLLLKGQPQAALEIFKRLEGLPGLPTLPYARLKAEQALRR